MRTIEEIKDGWQFSPAVEFLDSMPHGLSWEPVRMPHVWNLEDPLAEGPRLYRCAISLAADGEERLRFLSFGAVAGACRAWLNGVFLGEHRGGYARFRFPLQGIARAGSNELLVLADNTHRADIIPLGGDFNNYGGIYREVELISVGPTHFDLLHYGTMGVDLSPRCDGTLRVASRIIGARDDAFVDYEILDGPAVCAAERVRSTTGEAELRVEGPRAWNGLSDPHLYRLRARLRDGAEILDEVDMAFGFRRIEMTPDRGFLLNGSSLRLRGVSKHQDREGAGCASSREQQIEDIGLVREVGANALRLSHYQHPELTYDLCDREGLVVWAEIPMLAMPDGNDPLLTNARQQLTELILQCKHHPSICFWGIQNEIAMHGESLEMYRKTEALHDLAKRLDPDRITAAANLYCVKNSSQLNHISDMVGYNIYYGWYYGEMGDYEAFLDSFHRENPEVCLGISEYGVDSSTSLHSDDPKRKDYSEEFQCLYHETVFPQFERSPYLWGSFVWNMFDFGSARRDEGGVKGRNCKGLVTYDRAVKKDAFFYYKALWSAEPFVHIAGRRYERRAGETATIKVYSNEESITLSVNESWTRELRGEHVFTFAEVPLRMGENRVVARSRSLADEIALRRVEEAEKSYIYIDPNPGFNVKNWFTLGQGEEDLFPSDRYSIMDDMGTLAANPLAWHVLEESLPRVAGDPRSLIMPQISLLRVINRISGDLDEEDIKRLNRRLNTIEKQEDGAHE